MSEESSSPDAQDEQSLKKSPAKRASKSAAKPAKKESASETSEAKSVQSDKAADAESGGSRPPIKRNVRGTKKAAVRKTGKKDDHDGDSKDSDASGSDSSDGGTQGKQVRRGRSRGRGRQDQSRQDEPEVKLDRKIVAKRAWKIFLGEVSEEGLALIADKDARDLSRRSIRVAEIYSREEAIEADKNKVKKSK